MQTVLFAADHRGFYLKSLLIARAQAAGLTTHDLGTNDESSCDAGDFAARMAEAMRADAGLRGILICGSGQAMAMTANRFRHLRAALCTDTTMARLARSHNDANILVLGAHIVGQEVAQDCFDTFIATPCEEGRFRPRIDKLTAMGGL